MAGDGIHIEDCRDVTISGGTYTGMDTAIHFAGENTNVTIEGDRAFTTNYLVAEGPIYGLSVKDVVHRPPRAVSAKKAEETPTPRRAEGPTTPQLGRNEKCWCGSTLKFKRCHGA